MDVNSSMCQFHNAAQHRFNEACIAFAANHNLYNLADNIGMERNVLRNMLNPNQARKLTPEHLVTISHVTGDYSIFNALLRDSDVVITATDSTTGKASQVTLLKRVLEHSVNAGELSTLALEHCGGSTLPRSTRQKLINRANAGINNLMLIISDLENRTQAASPFLAMGVDFAIQGMPIPGLS